MPQSYRLSSCLQTVNSEAVIFYNTLAEKLYSIDFIAPSLESSNLSILAARNLFKDFGGEKIRIL